MLFVCTPGSINSLFGDFFRELWGIVLEGVRDFLGRILGGFNLFCLFFIICLCFSLFSLLFIALRYFSLLFFVFHCFSDKLLEECESFCLYRFKTNCTFLYRFKTTGTRKGKCLKCIIRFKAQNTGERKPLNLRQQPQQ